MLTSSEPLRNTAASSLSSANTPSWGIIVCSSVATATHSSTSQVLNHLFSFARFIGHTSSLFIFASAHQALYSQWALFWVVRTGYRQKFNRSRRTKHCDSFASHFTGPGFWSLVGTILGSAIC